MLPMFAFERLVGESKRCVGIGLSTANSLVKALGGQLSFDVDTQFQTFSAVVHIPCGKRLEDVNSQFSFDNR